MFPLVFSLALSGFTAYSVLSTLVFEHNNGIKTSDDEDKNINFISKIDIEENNPINNNEENPITPIEEKKPFDGEVLYSYKDESVSFDIYKENIKTKHMSKDRLMDTIVYYVDVRVIDLSHMRARFAKNGQFGLNIEDKTSNIAREANAKLAISGDNYGKQEGGYVLRNGIKYRSDRHSDNKEDLVIWGDGSFQIIKEKEISLDSIKAIVDDNDPSAAWQIYCFGPALVVDSQIHVKEDDEVSVFSTLGNQRCSIGIFEPFHYLFAICDGRLKDSYGMSLYEMASFMKNKGAKIAYNLDGGGSATLWYDGKVLNRPNTNGERDLGERKISDIIYIR